MTDKGLIHYAAQSFWVHGAGGQTDRVSCHRFQVTDAIATYNKPDLISSHWAFSMQEEFSVNKWRPNAGILFDYFSSIGTTVKPWRGLMHNPFDKAALKSPGKISFKSIKRIQPNSSVSTALAKSGLRSEKWVTTKKYTNYKTGYIGHSAMCSLTFYRQNSIKGFELFTGGNNFFDEYSFELRSCAHKQSALKHRGLTFKIKDGIDF